MSTIDLVPQYSKSTLFFTFGGSICVEALEGVIETYATTKILNTNPGCLFTIEKSTRPPSSTASKSAWMEEACGLTMSLGVYVARHKVRGCVSEGPQHRGPQNPTGTAFCFL